jgi:hypothetical protein
VVLVSWLSRCTSVPEYQGLVVTKSVIANEAKNGFSLGNAADGAVDDGEKETASCCVLTTHSVGPALSHPCPPMANLHIW